MKILVTGANGQLGHDVIQELSTRGVDCKGVDLADFDLTDADAVRCHLTAYAPTHVVHCAAYTAVDKAEEQRDACYHVNVLGTKYVAQVCKELSAPMVYLSTDYVFDGESKQTPWETDDHKAPLNHYGFTKYEGELAVRALLTDYFIVRISWVFGKNGANFVKTMLRLAETRDEVSVVRDQIGAPTYTPDLAKLLCDMLETERYGTYHASNEGDISWYDFACEIFRQANRSVKVNAIPSSQFPAAAKRPQNSRLSKRSLDDAGFARLPRYEDALARYLKELEP